MSIEQVSQTRSPRAICGPVRTFCSARDALCEFSNNEHLRLKVLG